MGVNMVCEHGGEHLGEQGYRIGVHGYVFVFQGLSVARTLNVANV